VKRPTAKSEPEALLEIVTDSLSVARAASTLMRRLRAKSEPEARLEMVTDSLAGIRDRADKGTFLKAAVIAGGVAALTAGSAGISSLRRRIEENS
jgi:hypothetical protein